MADKTTVKKTTTKKAVTVKTMSELNAELVKLTADLLQAKLGNAAGELTNPRMITVIRKNIARTHSAIGLAQKKSEEEKS